MNLPHQHIGGNLVELYKLQKVPNHLLERIRVGVTVLLAPHECRLELGELIRAQILTGQDQPYHVLRQQRETAQVQHLIAVLVDKLQHLLHQTLGALVLDVPLGRSQQGAHGVHVDAALDKATAGTAQLLQPVVIGRVHDAQQRPRLQRDTARVDVLDELAEHVRLELFDDQRLVLLAGRLGMRSSLENG